MTTSNMVGGVWPPNVYAPNLGVGEQIVKLAQKQLLDEMFWLYENASEYTMIDFWTELGYYDENGGYVDKQEG